MRNLLLLTALLSSALVLDPPRAHAASKAEKAAAKQWSDDAKAAWPGTVWALKDLPVTTGNTMGMPWISALVKVTSSGVEIPTTTVISSSYGGASSVWYGVRANEVLKLESVELEDGHVEITFVGTGASEGRDTRLQIDGATTLADVKSVLDQLVTVTDPVDPTWPEDVKAAIKKRQVINGMTKRQAYLSVGEPTSATTQDIGGGKSVEMWVPRTNNGLRIGFGASMEMTQYPQFIKFQDGKAFDMPKSGGVSLE